MLPIAAAYRIRVCLLALFLVGCEEGRSGDEIWRIDFETHRAQIEVILAQGGFDYEFIRTRTLEYVGEFYEGIEIQFELGPPAQGRSSICVRPLPDGLVAVFGRGLQDDGNNDVEELCEDGPGDDRGVFIDAIWERVRPLLQSGSLAPFQQEDKFAEFLALVLAHEIGHGLGLRHDNSVATSIMRASPAFSLSFTYAFTEDNVDTLLENVPP